MRSGDLDSLQSAVGGYNVAYFQYLSLMRALCRSARDVPCCQCRRESHVARCVADDAWLHHFVLAATSSGGGVVASWESTIAWV